jgi:hypothetical protein
MGKTRKHIDKGKFHNGLLYKIPEYLRKTWHRHNWDIGELRKAKKDLEDKIAEKELKTEVRIIEAGENIDYDIPEQDEILEQIFGRS